MCCTQGNGRGRCRTYCTIHVAIWSLSECLAPQAFWAPESGRGLGPTTSTYSSTANSLNTNMSFRSASDATARSVVVSAAVRRHTNSQMEHLFKWKIQQNGAGLRGSKHTSSGGTVIAITRINKMK